MPADGRCAAPTPTTILRCVTCRGAVVLFISHCDESACNGLPCRESCTKRIELSVKFSGPCGQCDAAPLLSAHAHLIAMASDPCAPLQCPSGTRCKLNAKREPECKCSEQCHFNGTSVCASNGKTYRYAIGQDACFVRIALRTGAQERVHDARGGVPRQPRTARALQRRLRGGRQSVLQGALRHSAAVLCTNKVHFCRCTARTARSAW